jgi:hypothetical protein
VALKVETPCSWRAVVHSLRTVWLTLYGLWHGPCGTQVFRFCFGIPVATVLEYSLAIQPCWPSGTRPD